MHASMININYNFLQCVADDAYKSLAQKLFNEFGAHSLLYSVREVDTAVKAVNSFLFDAVVYCLLIKYFLNTYFPSKELVRPMSADDKTKTESLTLYLFKKGIKLVTAAKHIAGTFNLTGHFVPHYESRSKYIDFDVLTSKLIVTEIIVDIKLYPLTFLDSTSGSYLGKNKAELSARLEFLDKIEDKRFSEEINLLPACAVDEINSGKIDTLMNLVFMECQKILDTFK